MRAPIALFAYRRAHHLELALTGLTRNPEAADSLLYVFSDAPKDERAAEDVRQVRELVHDIHGFGEVHVIQRKHNFGLARSIIDGVSHVLSKHDAIIVVEDDLIASPHMLRFFNNGLALYRDQPRVANITAYCYPVAKPLPDTYFLRGADCCWGWATWRDRWQHFNPHGGQLLEQLRATDLSNAFDLDGETQFTDMLEDQIAGRNDSWAIRWHASCFLRDVLTLYPGRSLVQNIGFDGINSTHCRPTDRYDVIMHTEPVRVGGIEIEENLQAREVYKNFFRRARPPFFQTRKLLRRLRNTVATQGFATTK